MKRTISLVLSILLLAALAVPASATEFLYMATGGTSGTYYALGGELANLFAKNGDDLDVTAQSTGASAENIRLIDQGEAELGIVQNDVADYAFNGINAFEGEQIQSFATVASLYPEFVQLVAHGDAGIETIADLKGKRVSIGAAGSGVYFNAIDFLTVAGLTVEDIDAQYLSFSESSDAIKNRQIDAAFIVAGIPNAAIQELASTSNVKLVALTPEDVAALQALRQFYAASPIPTGTYPGQEADVSAVAIRAILICKGDLSEDLVYNLTKTLYEKTGDLTHAKKAEIKLEDAKLGVSTPIHPGAARYYAEAGVN